ncbi:MAG: thiol:disulfide interchange protein DsbA/DsbL [Aquabacterium sp.]|nr:thiol:disulfide interchange protein DsbA/DsbL [Aquabacterium sp.]
MNRRDFSIQTLGAVGLGLGVGVGAGLPSLAWAQGAEPVEGTHYAKLQQAVPTAAPAGKIEVVEFFWYGCSHCNQFEPYLAAWAAKLPADVAFRRVPVAFREVPFGAHQRLYYALEAMGMIPALHGKVFHAMHEEGLKLDQPGAMADFLVKQGVDKAKFLSLYDSFSVQTKGRQARTLADAYKIDGVPALGISGLYYTSVGMNGSPEKALITATALINKVRKSK